jgi:hypothetical protein
MTRAKPKALACAVTVILVVSLPPESPAGLFDFVGDVVGGAVNFVGDVASLPFKAVGGLAGSAIDPALSGTFRRIHEVTDHAADRMDQVAKDNIERLDGVATDRLNQVDKILTNRINQVDRVAAKNIEAIDGVLKARIDQVDGVLDNKLDKIEAIASEVIDREARIVDESLTRLDQMLDKDITRLAMIEGDAFDRIEAALQDQVPSTVSHVTFSVEIMAAVVVFLTVVSVCCGIELYLELRKVDFFSTRTVSGRLGNLKNKFTDGLTTVLPRTVATVMVPLFVLLMVIQAGYYLYIRHGESARVARLDSAADLLAAAGDFRSAVTFRRRAYSLSTGDPDRRFYLDRDTWLADLSQSRSGLKAASLSPRYVGMKGRDDPEVKGAYLYFGLREANPGSKRFSDLRKEADEYCRKYLESDATYLGLTGIKALPVMGQLVQMGRIRASLDDPDTDIATRLKTARCLADQLTKKYPEYAPGFALQAQLRAYEFAALENAPAADRQKVKESREDSRKKIEANIAMVSMTDPDLYVYLKFRLAPLPSGLRENVTAAAAMEGERKTLGEAAGPQFEEFVTSLRDLIRPILSHDLLAKAEAERNALRVVAREAAELKVKALAANKDLNVDHCLRVSAAAASADQMEVAEVWLTKAMELATEPNLKKQIAKRTNLLRKQPIATRMFVVF